MKALSGKAFCRLLERHDWQLLRVQGSHHVYGKAGQRARISDSVNTNRARVSQVRGFHQAVGVDKVPASWLGNQASS